MSSILVTPNPLPLPLQQQKLTSHHHHPHLIKSPLVSFKTITFSTSFSSSPSSVSTVEEDNSPPIEQEDALSTQTSISPDDPNFRGCKSCGREEMEKNCNGEGRIQGGIATVPGFGWWPIKAYRPCPGFLASGGRYTRQGQSMDEVASGRGKRVANKKG